MLAPMLNHLWQSTLLAAVVALLAALLRGERASVRYWLWWAASVKFLVPFALLASLGAAVGDAAPLAVARAEWPAVLGAIAEPVRESSAWRPLATMLVLVWAVGAVGVALRWLKRAMEARALLSASQPYAGLPVMGGPPVRTSPALVAPALVGIVRPVLLLPRGIEAHLPRAQLAAVLEHELAHWRRRDNLTAAVHMLVETLFWFHPLVWWIGARLLEERERACDEAVVGAGHDGRTYAEGLLNVCERYAGSQLKCAAGVGGADLERRVVEIARRTAMGNLSASRKVLVGTFALGTVLVPFIFGAAAQDAAEPLPAVRIAPVYPEDAAAAGREGFVELEFTIAANGTTKDVAVVASSSPEFEEPAVAALLRWRYLPTNMECTTRQGPPDCRQDPNIAPVERSGVRTFIRYELDGGDPRIVFDRAL